MPSIGIEEETTLSTMPEESVDIIYRAVDLKEEAIKWERVIQFLIARGAKRHPSNG